MPKSPIAAVIPIPKAATPEVPGEDQQRAALDAISRIAAVVDAKPKPRAARKRREGDDTNGFLALF